MQLNSSSRQQKVAGLISQSLNEIFARGKQIDIRLIENKITITNVKISPDLKIATIYFLPFVRSKISSDEYLDALEASRFAIRKQLTEAINLKYSPEIRFFYDKGAENALEVESVLKRI